MKIESGYRWQSRPLLCKLGIHMSRTWIDYIQLEGIWIRRCNKCPYYWYP